MSPFGTFTIVEKLCRFVGWWNILPYDWDSTNQEIILRNRYKDKSKLIWLKWSWLALGTFILLVQNLLPPCTSTLIDKMMGGAILCISSALMMPHYVYIQKTAIVMLYINGVLRFHREHQIQNPTSDLRRRTLIEKLNMLCAAGVFITSIIFPPLFFYGLHWTNPCKPSLIGFWLLPECSQICPIENIWLPHRGIFHFSLLALNHITYQIAYPIAVFGLSIIQIPVMILLHDCLRIFQTKFQNARSHKEVEEAWFLHKEIQILADLNNDIQKFCLVSLYMVLAISLHAFSICSLVRLASKSNLTGDMIIPFLFFCILLLDSFLVIMVAFGGMSKLYLDSKKILSESRNTIHWKNLNLAKVNMKLVQKRARSCQTIKITFGQNNFVEELTPLNCLNASVGLAVQLLLLRE